MNARAGYLIAACLATACSGQYATELPDPGVLKNAVTINLDVVPPPVNGESQDCYYRKVESDVDLDVGRIVLDFSKGTHHMHVYATDDPTLSVDDHRESCFTAVNFDKWRLVFGEQREYTEWELPEGVAIHLKAHQQLLIQVHYVNIELNGVALTSDNMPKGKIEFDPLPPGTATQYMGSIFGQQRGVNIPPHAQQSISGICQLPHDVHMGSLAGHYHLRGQDFYAYKMNPDGSLPAPFYSAESFAEPAFDIYDPDTNPLNFKAGDKIQWHCDYDNQSDEQVWFGPDEQHQEHCNMFAFYYPIAEGAKDEFLPCTACGTSADCPADETCIGDGICRKACGMTGVAPATRTFACDANQVCLDPTTNKCGAAPQCTPSCAGKTCGDDGCGGTCGTGSCGSCTPSCNDKACGGDGCGGSCGTCTDGKTCSATGACVPVVVGNACDTNGGFEAEPNDTWTKSEASVLCADGHVSGVIATSSDVDWYTFTLAPGESYTLTLSSLPGDYTFNFYHLAESGNLSFIGRSTDNGDLADQVVSSSSVNGGTYFAKVFSAYGDSDINAHYKFTLTRE